MRNLALICVVTLLAGFACHTAAFGMASAPEAPPMKVMTFNLRYASNTPPNAWPQRHPVMRELILQTAPDLIGTQEGLYQQLKDLASDLPDYQWIGLGREGGSRGEFMAVFYRKDRFEPLEYDHYWLSDTPDVIGSSSWGNTVRRMVTWVRFLDRTSNRQFYFINTHFDHQVQESREKSAVLVRQRVENLKTGLPVILVGDFNAGATRNKAYDVLTAGGFFTDTWISAEKRESKDVGTFHNYKGPVANGDRIDWILIRGPVRAVSSAILTSSKDGQYPSDHFPVMATLRLAGEAVDTR